MKLKKNITATKKEKGNQLEEAVQAVESYIFSTQPALKESTIVFERNKIVNLKGAKNEIDLYAKIDFGKGYDGLYIFECKNWNKKVGKNEIIIFSEKIKESNANKGFFMAKEFTKDAISRSDNDGRIELVKVKTEIDLLKTFPIQYFSPSLVSSKIIMKGDIEYRSYLGNEIFEFEGTPITLMEIVNKLCFELQEEIFEKEPILMLTEHTFVKEKIFPFEHDELNFQGKIVKGVKASFTFKIEKITPVIKSQFNIEKRGRHYTIEFNDLVNKVIMTTAIAELE